MGDKAKKNLKLDIELIDDNAQTFFCNVCYNDVDIKLIMYLTCGHYFCRDCFKQYFYTNLLKGDQIQCP